MPGSIFPGPDYDGAAGPGMGERGRPATAGSARYPGGLGLGMGQQGRPTTADSARYSAGPGPGKGQRGRPATASSARHPRGPELPAAASPAASRPAQAWTEWSGAATARQSSGVPTRRALEAGTALEPGPAAAPVAPQDIPRYLQRYGYAAMSATTWATASVRFAGGAIRPDIGGPKLELEVTGHQEIAGHTWYVTLCTLTAPGRPNCRVQWQVLRRLAHLREGLHDPVKFRLGAAVYERYFGETNFAHKGGLPGTTARLHLWCLSLATIINEGFCVPSVVALALRFLGAPGPRLSQYLLAMIRGKKIAAEPQGYEDLTFSTITHTSSGIEITSPPVRLAEDLQGCILLYHYTHRQAFEAVRSPSLTWEMMWKTLTIPHYTGFGEGIFMTTKAPDEFGSQHAVLVNNFTNAKDGETQELQVRPFQECARYCVPIVVHRSMVVDLMQEALPELGIEAGSNQRGERLRADRNIWVLFCREGHSTEPSPDPASQAARPAAWSHAPAELQPAPAEYVSGATQDAQDTTAVAEGPSSLAEARASHGGGVRHDRTKRAGGLPGRLAAWPEAEVPDAERAVSDEVPPPHPGLEQTRLPTQTVGPVDVQDTGPRGSPAAVAGGGDQQPCELRVLAERTMEPCRAPLGAAEQLEAPVAFHRTAPGDLQGQQRSGLQESAGGSAAARQEPPASQSPVEPPEAQSPSESRCAELNELAARLRSTPMEDAATLFQLVEALGRVPVTPALLREAQLGILTRDIKDHPDRQVRHAVKQLRNAWKEVIQTSSGASGQTEA